VLRLFKFFFYLTHKWSLFEKRVELIEKLGTLSLEKACEPFYWHIASHSAFHCVLYVLSEILSSGFQHQNLAESRDRGLVLCFVGFCYLNSSRRADCNSGHNDLANTTHTHSHIGFGYKKRTGAAITMYYSPKLFSGPSASKEDERAVCVGERKEWFWDSGL